jgi:hypothetical protein
MNKNLFYGLIAVAAVLVVPAKCLADNSSTTVWNITPINITSPQGGEMWPMGSSQTISWDTSKISGGNVELTLIDLSASSTQISFDSVPGLTGSYQWTVGVPKFPISPGSYQIQVLDTSSVGCTDSVPATCSETMGTSNTFTITPGTAPPALLSQSDPAGTNIISNGTVYYIAAPAEGGAPLGCTEAGSSSCPALEDYLIPYPNAAVFESYGFNSWASVVPASAADMALQQSGIMNYADGSLVDDHGTVYYIEPSTECKAPFTSAQVFLGMGYSFSSVISGDTSFDTYTCTPISAVGPHPAGTLISQNGTIYYITISGKMGFPSLSVFDSWGFKFDNVVAANSYDASLSSNPYGSVVLAWTLGQLSPAATPSAP